MKIISMETFNFRGLKGSRRFNFEEIMAVLGKNAAGKSSFIDALIYGLTGIEPAGDMITAGESQAGVQITFEDGSKFMRVKRPSGTVLKIGKNRANKRDFDAAMAAACKTTAGAMRIVTSSEVLAKLRPSELGDFLMSYLGERLTLDGLLDMITDGTCADKMRDLARKTADKIALPDKFGIGAVDTLYNAFYDYRKKYNAAAKTDEAQWKALTEQSEGIPDDADKEALLKEKQKLTANRDKWAAYEAELRAYTEAKRRYTADSEAIAALDRQIEAITVKERPEGEREALLERLGQIKAEAGEARQLWSTMNASVAAMEKAYQDLGRPTCPLSPNLTCTTDKSAITEELRASISGLRSQAEGQKARAEALEKEEQALNKELLAIEAEKAELMKKNMLIRQREARAKTMGQAPTEPVKKDAWKNASARIEEIDTILNKMKLREEAKAYAERKDQRAALAAAFDGLVRAFSPKGIVKENIMSSYMDFFTGEANKAAALLRPGMAFRFVSENGVLVTADMHGTGDYLSYASLSNGEKSVMLLALMTMLNGLTGFRLLIMDEMSVLDAETFGAVVRLLKATASTRDHAVIAAVDHTDTAEALAKEGVKAYSL